MVHGGGATGARWALVAASGLLVVACGTDRETTRPDPVPVTQARLERSTVTFEDLGDSYRRAEPEGGIGVSVVEHPCDNLLEELVPREEAASAATDGQQVLESVVAWFPGQGAAVPDQFRAAAAECAEVSESGAENAVRASLLDFGALSDDSLALSFEREPANGPITEDAVVVMRRGDLVSVLRLTGPRPVSRETLDEAARVAIGRLSLLQDETSDA